MPTLLRFSLDLHSEAFIKANLVFITDHFLKVILGQNLDRLQLVHTYIFLKVMWVHAVGAGGTNADWLSIE